MKLYIEGICIFLYFIGFLVSGIVEDEDDGESHVSIGSPKESKESFR